MTSFSRRIALLTGSSIAVLGAATPALAAPHDTLANGTYVGTASTASTIELCDIAVPPGSPCFFGVIDDGPSPSNAVVNSTLTGTVSQNPAAAGPGVLTNAGSAEIGAIAIATGAALATANATPSVGLVQIDTGAAVDLTIDNNGTLLIDAVASASATAGAANANANMLIVDQFASGGDIALDLTNDGDLSILADADAVAATAAVASAFINGAVLQTALGTDVVTVDLNNNGGLSIAAERDAGGSAAAAEADVVLGIGQFGNRLAAMPPSR